MTANLSLSLTAPNFKTKTEFILNGETRINLLLTLDLTDKYRFSSLIPTPHTQLKTTSIRCQTF